MREFTPYAMKHRRDQVSKTLNDIKDRQDLQQDQIVVYNNKRTSCIVIGQQPDNSFGIKVYDIKGDRKEIKETIWILQD